MLHSAQKLRKENALSEFNTAEKAEARTNLGVAQTFGDTIAIVDASATSLFDVACVAGSAAGGVIRYSVFATNGTDHQSLTGIVTYAMVNKADTNTLVITEVTANQAKAVSSGTLTLAWTFVTGTSKGTVKLQPTGSLTETTFNVTYVVEPIRGSVTIL